MKPFRYSCPPGKSAPINKFSLFEIRVNEEDPKKVVSCL
jgi:hypothetical protein